MQQSATTKHICRAALAIVLCALAAVIVLAVPQPAHAAKAKNSGTKNVYSTDYVSFSKYDITGDGKKDKIEIVRVEKSNDYYHGLGVVVNGKVAYIYTDYSYGFYGFKAKVMVMSNHRGFLYLNPTADNDDGPNLVLAWKGGKLKKVANLNKAFSKSKGAHAYVNSIKAKGNRIVAVQSYMNWNAGGIGGKFTYKYKKGKLVRTAKSGTWARFNAKKAKAQMVHANRMLKVYKSPTSKVRKFSISKGKALKVTKLYVNGKKVAVQVRYGGGKGWVKIPNRSSYGKPLFRETFFAG